VACGLLGQNVMVTAASSSPPCLVPSHLRQTVLRFAASFVWADLEVVESERRFLAALAVELDPDGLAEGEVERLLSRPPPPEEIDPNQVPRAIADIVRRAALRAIAADGRVDRAEMDLFDLLDELLPRSAPPGERLSSPRADGAGS
jgi:hypothetical protein